MATLVTPNVKLYGHGGSGPREITIIGEAQLQVTLDGHHVSISVLVQSGVTSVGVNVLQVLGVKFLLRSLVMEPEGLYERIPQPIELLLH